MKTIDCLGEICPIPAIRLKQELLRTKPGESFMIVSDHSCVPVSVGEYCKRQGICCKSEEVINGVWELTITVPKEK